MCTKCTYQILDLHLDYSKVLPRNTKRFFDNRHPKLFRSTSTHINSQYAYTNFILNALRVDSDSDLDIYFVGTHFFEWRTKGEL